MRTTILTLMLLLAGGAAQADDWVPPVRHAQTQKECGHCHMAFQPAFLPARSWARMMDELPDHFGEDASLPAETAAAVRAYLEQNAGDAVANKTARKYLRWVKPAGTPQRLTENPAFLKEHRFRPEVWARPDVVTPSNCPACHRDADQGWYED